MCVCKGKEGKAKSKKSPETIQPLDRKGGVAKGTSCLTSASGPLRAMEKQLQQQYKLSISYSGQRARDMFSLLDESFGSASWSVTQRVHKC